VYGPGIGKAGLPLGGVDVKIRQRRVDVDVEGPQRVDPVGEPALDPVFQGLEQAEILNPAAVGKDKLLPPVVPVKFRPPRHDGYPETFAQGVNFVEKAPFPDGFYAGTLQDGGGETVFVTFRFGKR
jgi:hypothetical protein